MSNSQNASRLASTSSPHLCRAVPGIATQVSSKTEDPTVRPTATLTTRIDETNKITTTTTAAAPMDASSTDLQRQLHQQQQQHLQTCSGATTSCPDSPIRRVSSSLKNSALDFASRFFNKCKAATFTVDGATYTIVASTPENPQKRDEANASSTNTITTATTSQGLCLGASSISTTSTAGGSIVATSTTQSPTGYEGNNTGIAAGGNSTSINGQVARHGSLTIVRRSNSRKNFTQTDAQQSTTNLLSSPSATIVAVPIGIGTITSPPTNTTPEFYEESRLGNQSLAAATTTSLSYNNKIQSTSNNFTTTTVTSHLEEIPPTEQKLNTYRFPPATSSNNIKSTSNNYNNITSSSTSTNPNTKFGSRFSSKISTTNNSLKMSANKDSNVQPISPNEENFVTSESPRSLISLTSAASTRGESIMAFFAAPTEQEAENESTPSVASQSIHSNVEQNVWETENLPNVETPDALNKAALRIRTLLRRMDHEQVPYQDLQRNLHYAARVLEAVFIDESSRSPTSGKTKLGQIASSSVESEVRPQIDKAAVAAIERCDGNCKNLNCNQHSHSNHPAADCELQTAALAITTLEEQQQQNNNNTQSSSCNLHSSDTACEEVTIPEVEIGHAEAETFTVDKMPVNTDDDPQEPQTKLDYNSDASHNQISIECRTKGVSLAPQTHSGPTGPPDGQSNLIPALDTVTESVLEEFEEPVAKKTGTQSSINTTKPVLQSIMASPMTMAILTNAGGISQGGVPVTTSPNNTDGPGSGTSNNATAQRQKRMRIPAWARSMSTNKTYLTQNGFFSNYST